MRTKLHLVYLFVLLGVTSVKAQIEILSGFEAASNYEIAEDISRIYSDSIVILTTTGSIDNLEKLTAGKVGFVQYDVLQQELLNDLMNNTKLTTDVAVLLPLGNEEIHIIAKSENLQLKSFEDLNNPNVKVSIGSEGQGTSVTASIIKELTDSKWTDVHLGFEQSIQALLKDEIDAFFFVGAAPVSKLTVFAKLAPHHKKQIQLIALTDERIADSYLKTEIPANTYKWASYAVETYAVKSLLVTRITNETSLDRNNTTRLLADIKMNVIQLQEKGHPQWWRVNFNYKGINWEIHDIAKKLFIEDPNKKNGNVNVNGNN